MWVLTKEYNDYDQHGEYFVDVFYTIPTRTELATATGFSENDNMITHILNGGGRLDNDYDWYYLRQHKE